MNLKSKITLMQSLVQPILNQGLRRPGYGDVTEGDVYEYFEACLIAGQTPSVQGFRDWLIGH